MCSPVGMNKEIITDGVSGFLVFTEDEWINKGSSLFHVGKPNVSFPAMR